MSGKSTPGYHGIHTLSFAGVFYYIRFSVKSVKPYICVNHYVYIQLPIYF